MNQRWALIVSEEISAVVEQGNRPPIDGDWRELTGVFGPGDACVDGRFFRAGSAELAAYLETRNQPGTP
jgi:hypothetical protein